MQRNKKSNSKKRVLLIDGGSRQVLPLIEGFHKMGWSACVFCGSKLDVGYVSRFTDERFMGVVDFSDEKTTYASLIETTRKSHFDLLIPMCDFFATILSKNKSEFPSDTVVYVNDWQIFHKAIDKLQTMVACMDNGIPCPKTAIFSNFTEFDSTEWSYPLVIKPRTGFGAKGFLAVSSEMELINSFKMYEKKFGPMLIQEYIPQTDKQYQAELLIDKNGVCKAFVLMEKVRWYPLEGGSSTMNRTMHDEKIKEDCVRLMNAIGWRGYASLDLIRDPRDGIAKIMEINPRINGTAKICFASGVNLSKLIIEDAFNLDVTDQTEYKDGIGLRYFHMDVLWFLKSKNRFKVRPSWFSNKNTVDEIISLKDIKPAFTYSIIAIKKLRKDKSNRSVNENEES